MRRISASKPASEPTRTGCPCGQRVAASSWFWVASGFWCLGPEPPGASINAVGALAAVVCVLRHAERKGLELADALRYAVSLGGGTDTIAAIVGGILGSRLEDVAEIPWLPRRPCRTMQR